MKKKPCNNKSLQGDNEQAYTVVRNAIIEEGAVFFGGYASSFYANYMSKSGKTFIYSVDPDFDAFTVDPESCVERIQKDMEKAGIETNVVPNPPVGEIVPKSYTVLKIGTKVATIYGTTGCHNYNRVRSGKHSVHIATTDTMLNFLLALYFTTHNPNMYCMAYHMLFVQQKTKLLQNGILKRFNSSCNGRQLTLGDMKAEKARIIELYRNKVKDEEYDLHMFKYVPK